MSWEYKIQSPIFFNNVPLNDNIIQLPDEIQMNILNYIHIIQSSNKSHPPKQNNILAKKNIISKSKNSIYRKLCLQHDLFLFKYVLAYE